jgi:hypothetical protein
MPDCRYDAEKHLYFIDGVNIPSFSEIAKANGLFDYSSVSEEVMEASRQFGSAAHKACQLWDMGQLDEDSLSAPLVPYLDGWKKFCSNFGVVIYPQWIETPIFSAKYQFGTTPDRIVSIGNKMTVIEIKTTTTVQKAVAIQTAAQKLAFEENYGSIRQRIAVQLVGKGKYKIHEYKKLSDETTFKSAVNIYYFKKESGLWKV